MELFNKSVFQKKQSSLNDFPAMVIFIEKLKAGIQRFCLKKIKLFHIAIVFNRAGSWNPPYGDNFHL